MQRKIVSFPKGSWVMVIDPTKTQKSQPTYLGPYQVIRRNTGGAYVLQDSQGNIFNKPPEQLKRILRTEDEKTATRFNAKRVLDHRGDEQTRQFCIEWFTDEDKRQESWVSAENIENPAILKEYWERVQREHADRNKPVLSAAVTRAIYEQQISNSMNAQQSNSAITNDNANSSKSTRSKRLRDRTPAKATNQPSEKRQRLVITLPTGPLKRT